LGFAGSTHHWDTSPSATLASSPWTHTTSGYPPFGYGTGSTTTGIPATHLRWTPAQSQSHRSLRYPSPTKSISLQALLCPSYAWDDWTPAPQTPAQQALQSYSSMWNTGALTHWDRHQPGVRQPHPKTCQEPCLLSRASPSSTGFPDNPPPSSCWAALEGSKHA
jgi:hypothetical protein